MQIRDLLIRQERETDYRTVETLVRECFWNVYRPGCVEHFVLKKYREHPDFVRDLDFVLLHRSEIIGQIAFVKSKLTCDCAPSIPILSMGPICIAAAFQHQGLGTYLLRFAFKKAAELNFKAVCFEGNILFYRTSGCVFANTLGIRYAGLPEGADDSFFLCRELQPGFLGNVNAVYEPPAGYMVAQTLKEEFSLYEAGFPYKEKLVLESQIF